MRAFWIALLCLLLLLGFAFARIAGTWRVYTETLDEPAHLAAGMEWLDRGTYRYQRLHPPLARVAVALGPFLAGYRSRGETGIGREGNAILHSRGDGAGALSLARAGILPFFALATTVVFLWGYALGGPAAAALAALSFTTLPPVLAHAGLATTDMAATATIAAALFAYLAWLQHPTLVRSLLVGAAVGAALLAKLSALVYLPAAMLPIGLVWLVRGHRGPGSRTAGGLIAALAALLVVWAGYRFEIGPLVTPGPRPRAGPVQQALLEVASHPIYPAPTWVRGVRDLRKINNEGRKNVVLGQPTKGGRWYFFPLALGVKTPLPFLLLTLAGLGALALEARQRARATVPLAGAAGILGAAMATNLTIGLRHVLPLYPLLALCAATGALALWRMTRWRPLGPGVAVVLLLWQGIDSWRAHPDYLPWFNEVAALAPQPVLLDSDLDWGQDLGRLADTLRARGVDRVALAYHGKADLTRHGLPPFTEREAGSPATGWVAASLYRLHLGFMGSPGFNDFAWLREQTPVARVGRSILLYYVPAPERPGR
ncbi:MAG: hypothetical protein ACREMG_05135 [Gemmatimonadales bacterium]